MIKKNSRGGCGRGRGGGSWGVEGVGLFLSFSLSVYDVTIIIIFSSSSSTAGNSSSSSNVTTSVIVMTAVWQLL